MNAFNFGNWDILRILKTDVHYANRNLFSCNLKWNVISCMNICLILVISNLPLVKGLQHLLRDSHIRKGPSPPSPLTGKSPAAMAAAPSKATSLEKRVMTNLTLKELTSASLPNHLFSCWRSRWTPNVWVPCQGRQWLVSKPSLPLMWSYRMMKVWDRNIMVIWMHFISQVV